MHCKCRRRWVCTHAVGRNVCTHVFEREREGEGERESEQQKPVCAESAVELIPENWMIKS